MIEHLVLIRWKPETTADEMTAILDRAKIMEGIEGVDSVVVHTNLARARPEQGKGIGHALRVFVKDADTLAAFGPAPLHREFAAHLTPAVDDITIIDLPL